MISLELKEELKHLIDTEEDSTILTAMLTLLKRKSADEILRKKLTKRALRSNQQIARGELLSREEMENLG